MLLPILIMYRLLAWSVKGSRYGSIADVVGWHGTSDLRFTVKSTYMAHCGQESGSDHNVWRVLHHYKSLPQVKHFLWLVHRGHLMMNEERV
ncbi:hypothetical protein V6N13_099508 [Hibiscus sabdariffa]